MKRLGTRSIARRHLPIAAVRKRACRVCLTPSACCAGPATRPPTPAGFSAPLRRCSRFLHREIRSGPKLCSGDRLRKKISDPGAIRLVRSYLNSGTMLDGVVITSNQGTPQGGPLSPLLANVLLDDVDKELERRGHCFVRYADDANVYVNSLRAGQRVMALLRRLYTRLGLKVNERKSAVASAFGRKFLGYSLGLSYQGRSGAGYRGLRSRCSRTASSGRSRPATAGVACRR